MSLHSGTGFWNHEPVKLKLEIKQFIQTFDCENFGFFLNNGFKLSNDKNKNKETKKTTEERCCQLDEEGEYIFLLKFSENHMY